jgi:hypothetical protein
MLSCRRVGVSPNKLARTASRSAARSVQADGGLAALGPGCLLVVAICAALAYGVYLYLPRTLGGDPTVPRVVAALIGIIGGLGLQSLWAVLRGFTRGSGSFSNLVSRAKQDGPAEDGAFIIATGTVRAERPLTSPLGGVACATYDYRMFRRTGRSARDENEVPVYWGYAGQPFSIDSRGRRYPVAAVPLPADDAATIEGDAAVARARQYVRATGWETVEYRMLGVLDTVFQRLQDDSPQGIRRDFAVDNDQTRDVSLLLLEETTLPIGAQASVFGTWSASLGAIVAPPSPLPGSRVIAALGGPEALRGKPGVPQSTTQYVLGAIVMIVLAVGLFWAATIILPTVEL